MLMGVEGGLMVEGLELENRELMRSKLQLSSIVHEHAM